MTKVWTKGFISFNSCGYLVNIILTQTEMKQARLVKGLLMWRKSLNLEPNMWLRDTDNNKVNCPQISYFIYHCQCVFCSFGKFKASIPLAFAFQASLTETSLFPPYLACENALMVTVKHSPAFSCWCFRIWFEQIFKWSPIMITCDFFSWPHFFLKDVGSPFSFQLMHYWVPVVSGISFNVFSA